MSYLHPLLISRSEDRLNYCLITGDAAAGAYNLILFVYTDSIQRSCSGVLLPSPKGVTPAAQAFTSNRRIQQLTVTHLLWMFQP
jgi:hypothetical protein